jgi:hypothetical protein
MQAIVTLTYYYDLDPPGLTPEEMVELDIENDALGDPFNKPWGMDIEVIE